MVWHRGIQYLEIQPALLLKHARDKMWLSLFHPLLPPGNPYPTCKLQLQLLRSFWQISPRKDTNWTCFAEAHSFSEPSAEMQARGARPAARRIQLSYGTMQSAWCSWVFRAWTVQVSNMHSSPGRISVTFAKPKHVQTMRESHQLCATSNPVPPGKGRYCKSSCSLKAGFPQSSYFHTVMQK